MTFHTTGIQEEDTTLIHDGAFLHLLPDGKQNGVYGATTKDTQHVKNWQWEFDGKVTGKTQDEHKSCIFHFAGKKNPGLEISRALDLEDGQHIRERLVVTNTSSIPIEEDFVVKMDTSFNGIFQVREENKKEDGFQRGAKLSSNRVSYIREDNGKEVATGFAPEWDARFATYSSDNRTGGFIHRFKVKLAPGESTSFGHSIFMDHGQKLGAHCELPSLNAWRAEFGVPSGRIPKPLLPVAQAADDLHAMMIRTESGIALGAGMPRFLAPFGRDQLLTALKIIPQDESQKWRAATVKGILNFLADNQGKETRHYTPHGVDGKPIPGVGTLVLETAGEIPHEVRYDEQSGLGLTDTNHPIGKRPFGRYYGTADTTPLFVAVASEYFAATKDKGFIGGLLPNLEKALDWIENPPNATRDAHGFLCYEALPEYIPGGALANKVWKDSAGSLVCADGNPLLKKGKTAQVASIEVQGYMYRAFTGAAEIYAALGDEKKATHYTEKAAGLQKNVLEHFLTTDSDGKPLFAMAIAYPNDSDQMVKLNVHSSNPAHALWTGVFGDKKNIEPILDSLKSPEHLWSGWGFRSLGKNEPGFNSNPESLAYHNGPVWTHEPIIEGLQRYGERELVDQATRALHELASILPSHSLPELVSGDARQQLKHTNRPVAPEPLKTASRIQTWSAAAMLKAMEIRTQEHLPDLTQEPSRSR